MSGIETVYTGNSIAQAAGLWLQRSTLVFVLALAFGVGADKAQAFGTSTQVVGAYDNVVSNTADHKEMTVSLNGTACYVTTLVILSSNFASVYLQGGPAVNDMAGGTFWSYNTSSNTFPAITVADLAACLNTPASNISGLSQNGTDGTFATDTYMGFSFTLLAPAGNLAAGYHEYALTWTPASVTYVVNSADDQSFTFSGSDPALNMVVSTLGGTGQVTSTPLELGQYAVAATLPTGYAYAQAVCDDTDSTFDVVANTGTLNLAAGENVTCTFDVVNTRARATTMIGTMLETRGQLIVQNGPELSRRIGRLNGTPGAAGEISASGVSMRSPVLPFSLNIGGETTSFSYSSRARTGSATSVSVNPVATIGALTGNEEISRLSGKAAPFTIADNIVVSLPGQPNYDPMSQRWEIWAEGTVTKFGDAGNNGTFGIVHLGADYLLTPNLLMGLGAQVDWIDMADIGGSTVSGTGYMVGPYLTAKLSDRLYFDGRLAWGKSDNMVSPLGTYIDQVVGERWLATAALVGDFDTGAFNIRPEARLSYFSETTAAYVDGLGANIPAVTVSFGSFEIGPNISRGISLDNDALLTLTAGVDGIWTFALENSGALPAADPLTEGFRGRVDVGAQYAFVSGLNISASLAYDGIGSPNLNAWTASLGIEFGF